jgi:UDP-2,3-diacylglucosamine pyrophosphatase LpxH
MLVLLSDVHLTDKSSGKTIGPKAFRKFTESIEDMASSPDAKINNIEVVFLGDILDVIRCDNWLASTKIRPWSEPDDKDGKGENLENYTNNIVTEICNKNTDTKKYLSDFKAKMKKKGIKVKYEYIIGNHDWLINRYPETRIMAAKFLCMDKPGRYKEHNFPTEQFWKDYKLFARHGDIYDPFNFEDARDASSLGDAIVIELLNKFPHSVENAIGKNENPTLISLIREIDNVRPLVDVPIWIMGACEKLADEKISKTVKDVWNDLVDNFLKLDFVKDRDKFLWPDIVDALQFGLKISKLFSLKDLSSLPLRKLQSSEDDYIENAFSERPVKNNEAEFVVYGHTHSHKIIPLDSVGDKNNVIDKTYLNTGTWRTVHVRNAFNRKENEFSSWQVMTFIAFYLKEERLDRKFEVWNGALKGR